MKYRLTNNFLCVVGVIMLMGCSLGGDLEIWRAKAIERNEDKVDDQTYTVTFNTNGGSSVSAQIVKSGETVTRPANPNRDGYIFDNWYSNSALTRSYDFNTPVTADITLYAGWVIQGDITIIPPDILEDETIGGFTVAITISKTGTGYSSSHTIQVAAGYSSYEWYVDGVAKAADTGSEGRNFTIQATNYSIGRHTVTVIVTKDGKPYSNEQSFTVVN